MDSTSPYKVIIKGLYARIEPLNVDKYFSTLYENTKNPILYRYTLNEPSKSVQQYKFSLKERQSNTKLSSFLIFETEGDQALGIFSLKNVDTINKSAQIGSVLFGEKLQKTRIATEAVYLLIRYVFEQLKFVRCEWKSDSENQGSRKAAIRFGFRYEGELRRNIIVKGDFKNTVCYSMINEEWDNVKKQYQRWLSIQNFDEDKQQRTKLRMWQFH